MPLILVPFSPAYRQGVIDLILPIQQQEFGIPITAAEQPDLDDIPGFYQTGKGGFWLALDERRVVGTIGLKEIECDQAALRKMFVADDYRGASRGDNQGVAARLLQHLLGEARQNGIETVWLGTTSAFVAAHRFYEKHGFERVDETRLPASFPRMAVDTRFYRRQP